MSADRAVRQAPSSTGMSADPVADGLTNVLMRVRVA
jgi:hypothetical protein